MTSRDGRHRERKSLRRILVFGNSGSGKSTLAKSICAAEGLSHLDLDLLAWQAANPLKRRALEESDTPIMDFIQSNAGWVIEGCYTDLLERAVSFASEIIFMNLPIDDCISNAKKRPWEPHKYETKEAQDANLSMLIDWISQYSERTDTFSEQAHRKLYEGFQGKKTLVIRNQRSC